MSGGKAHEVVQAPAPAPTYEPADASLPAGLRHPSRLRTLAVWWDLFLFRVAGVRDHWYWYVMGWLVFPIAILFFMKMATAADPSVALYLITGNAVMALVFGPVQFISNDLAWLRQRNDLDFFATLPITRLQLVMAVLAVAALTSIPGTIINLLIGSWVVGLPLAWHPLFPLVLVLSVLSMAGIGVMIGVYARSGTHANIMNNLMLIMVMFLSPVFIPADRLPAVLQYTARVLPTTYVSHGLRATLGGDPAGLGLGMAVLVVWAVLTLWFATQRLEWRQE